MTNLPVLKVSASSLKTYQQCPRKYYFTYINKQPRKEWDHLDLGNFVHGALEEFHNQLQKTPQLPEKWGDVLTDACKIELPKYKLTPEHKVRAKSMLKVYLETLRTDGMPSVLYNEKSFNIKLNEGLLIRGFIDRIDNDPDRGYHIIDYKGLALDTPIPTPSGWTTMGELKVGDLVLGKNGKPTKVTIKSEIHDRPCYKMTLSDKSTVICDNVHNWSVGYRESGSIGNYDNVIETDELFKRFEDAKKEKTGTFVIENGSPLQLSHKNLLLDPWLLGAWIGGGLSKTGAFSVGSQDLENMTSLLREHWGEISVTKNKHIPVEYMRGSFGQRLALLQGLMDTDGSWNPLRKRCVFVTARKELEESVSELVRTLGVTVQNYTYTDKNGFISHRVEFRPIGFNPFKISRKKEAVDLAMSDNKVIPHFALRRSIVNIEKVQSVPTQCISVDAQDSLYLCGTGLIVTHNTGKSKYLDDFQLLIYGIYLLNAHPELERFKASYLVLSEDSKLMSYTFTQTDVQRVVSKIQNIASQIREDETWEPKPQFLCSYCDFEEICPVTLREQQFKQTNNSWE